MLFSAILDEKNNFFWTIFHLVLGVISAYTPVLMIMWFYFVLFTSVTNIYRMMAKGHFFFLLGLTFYLMSFELLDRMIITSPYIPYEISKYILYFISFVMILFMGFTYIPGLIMFVLGFPSLFYDLSGKVEWADLVNNFLAPNGIAFVFATFYQRSVTMAQFNGLLRIIWLTSISALICSIIKTPRYEDIAFVLHANSAFSGGAAANQAATIYGLAIFLSFYSVLNKLKFSGETWLDFVILCGFLYQGIISFSRGGIFVAFLALLVYYFVRNSDGRSNFNASNLKYFFLLFISVFMIFQSIDSLSGGQLLNRYKGHTDGTLKGYKEVTLDVYTSSRLSIFTGDIEIWFDNLFLGVGAGASRYLRKEDREVAAHIEMTRFLAEQGIFGLICWLILTITFYRVYKQPHTKRYRNLFLALFLLGYVSTFHSALRTYISPALFLLCILRIRFDDELTETI